MLKLPKGSIESLRLRRNPSLTPCSSAAALGGDTLDVESLEVNRRNR